MCPCPHHPFGCFGHPHRCDCAKDKDSSRQQRIADAMEKYRRDNIHMPLARLWNQLARVSMETK